MCNWVAAASATMQIAGDYLGQKSQARNAKQMMEAQATKAWQEYNYAYQNYEMERNDAYDAAVAEITKTRLNSMQLNSNVKAAIAENMSGRTADLLVKDAEGDVARTVATMQDNYTRKSNEIDLNEDTERVTLKNTLENINKSAVKMPSRMTNFVSSAVVGLNAYTNAQNQITSEKTRGKNTNKKG